MMTFYKSRFGVLGIALLAMTAVAAVAVLGFDLHPAAVAFAGGHHDIGLHTAEFGALAGVPTELKDVFDRIGKAFAEFKQRHDEEIKGVKKGFDDVVTREALDKVQKSLDDAVEFKTKIESAIAAEKKEREELELKLGRLNLTGQSTESAMRVLELKAFNDTMAAAHADRKQAFTALDYPAYDAYKSAFNAFLRKNERLLSAEEVKTLSVGSDPDGGYFVTPDLGGRIIKKVYETSPVRQNASVQPISTDALEGIEDTDEAGAGYAGEQAQGSDTKTPQLGKWRIPVYWIDTEPKATQQLLDDSSVDIEAWLSGKVGDKFSRFENSEFVNGAANKIRGFIGGYTTAADSGAGVTWGSIGYYKTGVNADFAASNPSDQLFELVALLKNAYLQNAKWFTRRSVINKVRKFKDGQGRYLWEPSLQAGLPETLLGYPVVRMEDIPALANGSLSMAFGDLMQAYQIVDRMGIRVLRDPFTSKPFVKFYTTKRTGGGIVNYEALKLMYFST
ncbi:HK97 family phage major capsid protein [Bradyrhizobium sp. LM2.7]